MSKERPHHVNSEIARYLNDQDFRRAYTVLYCHLQDSKEDGTKYYRIAELRFVKDPALGPDKIKVFSKEAQDFIETERNKFEEFIDGKSRNSIAKKIENTNSLLLLMILDLILKEQVYNCTIPLSECFTVGEESFYLLTHQYATNKNIKAKHQAGELELIVRWNHVVRPKFNNLTIHVQDIETELFADLKAKIDGPDPRLLIYSAEEHRVPYDWTICENSKLFYFNGYKSGDTPKSIVDSLKKASELDVPIVIFPELSVNEEAREDISNWLAIEDHNLLLVIAGSWHIYPEPGSADPMNESIVLDKNGQKVMTHSKTTVFSFKKDKDDEDAYHEGIVTCSRLNLAMFPFGLVTLLICKDFCDLLSGNQEALKYCSPDFIFLPTMGDSSTINAHDKAYNSQNVCFMPTLICSNQTPLESKDAEVSLGRIYCGIHAIELPNGETISHDFDVTTESSNIADKQDEDQSATESSKSALFAELPEDKLFRLRLRT